MTNITETPSWEPTVYQIGISDPIRGGTPLFAAGVPVDGFDNVQALQLANRTSYLKQQIETLAAMAISFPSYSALRTYSGVVTLSLVSDYNIGGNFKVDSTDTTSADNGGTIIVDAIDRRWKRLYSDAVNIKWFGAIGDGIADDTAAIQAAFDFATDRNQAVVIPSGTFLCSSKLILQSGRPISIIGEGFNTTEIRWNNAVNSGIEWDGQTVLQSSSVKFCIKDISLVTTQVASGSAIKINFDGGAGTSNKLFTADRVIIKGLGLSSYWDIGFDFNNVRNAVLNSCEVIGSSSNPTAMQIGYRLGDSAAENPVDVILSDCVGFFQDKAISIGDSGTGNHEGVSIIGGRYILNNYGVYWSTLNNKPLLHVVGTHIASLISCVYTRKNVQAVISDNDFYVRDETSLDFIGIDIQAATSVALDSEISVNIIRCNKSLTPFTHGIKVDGLSANISGNVITEPDIGILLPSTSQDIIASNNKIRLPSTAYQDTGTNNIINDFLRANLRLAAGSPKPNYITIDGASSGSPVKFTAGGSDTNVSLRMEPKGSGKFEVSNIPTYADDSAAGSAGLTSGQFYKTASGQVMVKL